MRLLALLLSLWSCYAYLGSGGLSRLSQSSLAFKKSSDSTGNNSGNEKSFFGRIKRFVSDVTRAKIEKQFNIAKPDSSNRYHLRLIRSPYDSKSSSLFLDDRQ